jgi:4-amino-4-deoxy-L-arabinose transferase-like glycosyltransferase
LPLAPLTPQQAGRYGRPAVLGLLAVLALLFFFRLGQDLPLRTHEALLAETARNMYAYQPIERPDGSRSNPYFVPNFNNNDRLKKTPLPYWTVAGLARLTGGVDEWTARLPSAAAVMGTILVLLLLVRRLEDPLTALLAAAAFGTFTLVIIVGHEAQADMLLVLLTTLSLAALWMGVERSGPRRFAWFVVSGAAGGLAMIAKGPMPLVVVPGPFLVAAVIVVLRLRRQAREGQSTRAEWVWTCAGATVAIALFVGILLPWVLKVPGAWNTLWSESVDRAVGDLGHKKRESVFFYFTRLPLMVAPWTIFFVWGLVVGVRRWWREPAARERLAYVGAWFLGTLAAISAVEGKQDHYVLPALPAAAIFTAMALRRLLGPSDVAQRVHGRRLVLAHGVAGMAAGLAGVGVGLWLLVHPAGAPKFMDILVTAGPMALVVVCGTSAIGCAAACVLAFRRRLVAGFMTLVVTLVAVFLCAWPTFMGPMDRSTPVSAFAREASARVPAQATLYSFPDANATVVYYAHRRIIDLSRPADVQAKVDEGRPFYLIAFENHRKELSDIRGLEPVLHRPDRFWANEGSWLLYYGGDAPPQTPRP